jgi:hypothetical protein
MTGLADRLDPVRDDFWRVRSPAAAAAPFKEWQHFIVLAPGLDVIINFNLSSHGVPASRPGGPSRLGDPPAVLGRVIVLARSSRWTGIVESHPRPELSTDGCRARFGDHRVEIRSTGYRVVVEAPHDGVVVDLTLRPAAIPIAARRQSLAPGRRLDWTLTARLAVDGHVELGDAAFALHDAVGYHDHNWGHFAWGDDFTWEWCSVLPTDPAADWAVVYSNLMNGARTQLALEQLFVWRAGMNVLAAGGLDVSALPRDRYRVRPALRLPRPMAVVQPRIDSDVPRRLEVRARSGADHVALDFAPESLAQLLVPSERSLRGVVAINEVVGPVAITCRLAGETIHWEGRGVFEFVRR